MRPRLHSIAVFRRIGGLGALALLCSTWSSLAQNSPPDSLPQTVGFNRDIRPILSDKCFKCHGPSSTSRRASLRLDSEDAVLKDATRNTQAEGTMQVIAPGDPERSTVMHRITATDPKRRMPFGGEPLSDRQVKLIGRWIEQGAKYEPLWSFIRPVRPELPQITNTGWSTRT